MPTVLDARKMKQLRKPLGVRGTLGTTGGQRDEGGCARHGQGGGREGKGNIGLSLN